MQVIDGLSVSGTLVENRLIFQSIPQETIFLYGLLMNRSFQTLNINPFVPNAPYLYLLKTSENL